MTTTGCEKWASPAGFAPRLLQRLSWLILPALLLPTGCSIQRMAVNTMVPVMEGTLVEAFGTGDIETASQAMPSQILLLRGLCRTDSSSVEIWTTTVQLYASYALAFVEAENQERADELYLEGYELGARFLRRQAWINAAWKEGPDALRAAIARKRPQELSALMMWTSACLGKHVLFNLDQPRVLVNLPYAYVLSDAAVDLDECYFYGMPHALKAVMLAAAPLGLGGDLDGSRREFEIATRLAGNGFLYHSALFANYYCVAAQDSALFTSTLERVIAAPADALPDVLLMNRIAQQWARELLAKREELF